MEEHGLAQVGYGPAASPPECPRAEPQVSLLYPDMDGASDPTEGQQKLTSQGSKGNVGRGRWHSWRAHGSQTWGREQRMPQARLQHLPSQPSVSTERVGPFQTAKKYWPSSLLKKKNYIVKTWREQFFPGQKGSKRCPSGQYPPFRGVSAPKKAAPD